MYISIYVYINLTFFKLNRISDKFFKKTQNSHNQLQRQHEGLPSHRSEALPAKKRNLQFL